MQPEPAPFEVLCLGETLVDMLSVEQADSLALVEHFHRTLGGSPANIAVQVARLGGRAGIVSKVGAGALGIFCRDALAAAGVGVEHLLLDASTQTTIVFVSRTPATPDFEAFRAGDTQLRADELPYDALVRAAALHVSTFALSREPCRAAMVRAIEVGAEQGALVSLDPNYHPRLWPDRAEALALLAHLYPRVTWTKPSLDDAGRLFGPGLAPQQYLERFHALGAVRVVLTLGSQGVWLSTPEEQTFVPPLPAEVRNATGAGDAFWAAFLLARSDGLPPRACIQFAQQIARQRLMGSDPTFSPDQRHAAYQMLLAQ